MSCKEQNRQALQCSCRSGYRSLCNALGESRRAWQQGWTPAGHLQPRRPEAVSAPTSAGDLRDLLAQSIIEIRTGKLDPKLANSISYLGTGFLRAIEVSDLENRLKALEARTENGNDGKS
jgi:hypothetical protein